MSPVWPFRFLLSGCNPSSLTFCRSPLRHICWSRLQLTIFFSSCLCVLNYLLWKLRQFRVLKQCKSCIRVLQWHRRKRMTIISRVSALFQSAKCRREKNSVRPSLGQAKNRGHVQEPQSRAACCVPLPLFIVAYYPNWSLSLLYLVINYLYYSNWWNLYMCGAFFWGLLRLLHSTHIFYCIFVFPPFANAGNI